MSQILRENQHVVSCRGFIYRALEEDWDPTAAGRRCQKLFWSLPAGFEVAPDDSDTRRVLQTSFLCANYMILANGGMYATAASSSNPGGQVNVKYKYLKSRQSAAGVLELLPDYSQLYIQATDGVVICVSNALCALPLPICQLTTQSNHRSLRCAPHV